MKVLHLTLKKKWFDMISNGEKKEEYREIKPYWETRLIHNNFAWVYFTNGYRPESRIMRLPCLGIEVKEGNPEWGAEPGKKYFVIKLGERV